MFGRRITLSFNTIRQAAILCCLYCYSVHLCFGSHSIISVQVEDQKEFVRLSLGWPQPVNFNYAITSQGFEIKFFNKADLLLDRLIKVFPGSVYKHDGEKTILTIHTSPKRKFIAKSYGNITYLDVYKVEAIGSNLITRPVKKESSPPQLATTQIKREDQESSGPDLQNLFIKIADYLGGAASATLSTIVSSGERGVLLKYPQAPIAVYESEDKIQIVVLSDDAPNLEKQLEEKYLAEVKKLEKGFVLQLTNNNLAKPIAIKTPEGWRIEFMQTFAQGNAPQFFIRDVDSKIKMPRVGLSDPIDVNGISVFCTLDTEVFVPIQMIESNFKVFATSVGAAFKLDTPENLTLDKDFIFLDIKDSKLQLPKEKVSKIDLNSLNLSRSFLADKQKVTAAMIASTDQTKEKPLGLAMLYLKHLFFSEADAEVIAYGQEHPEADPEQLMLLRAVAGTADNTYSKDVLDELFRFHHQSLEGLAWYALALAQGRQQKIPMYLAEYLMTHIDSLSDPLKSMLLIPLLDRLITQGDIELAEAGILKVNDGSLPTELIFLKQFLHYQIKRTKPAPLDATEPEKLLGKTKNPILMARLIIESSFVDWKKSAHHKYIETLESLLPLLEGSLIHLKAIEYLSDYYINMKDYLGVLDSAALLQKYYPEAYLRAKPKVQNIIYGILRDKEYEKIGLIETLKIFNRFVDAIPANVYFVDFILDLTMKLQKIGVFNESVQLLESYLQRSDVRLNPEKQKEVFKQLLDFHIENENEVRALEIIAELEKNKPLTDHDLDMIQVSKARLAELQNKPDEALKILHHNHSLAGLEIKSSIFWRQQNWSAAADTLSEIVEQHHDQLDVERKERYIVHLAAALVLNEKKYASKHDARQRTRLTLQGVTKKYADVLTHYNTLFHELTTEPHNSLKDKMTKGIIKNEINETNRLEKLFDQVKAVPTH